ncbi:DUF5074 domain-containing protein [Flavobacterium sp.]|uniref:YncE family protein n=1 Tax=Flavobacterium sp. TaxID=239 RepID=UPI00286D8973|nr:DUF5074 domain-containing protein [Flavobacterium sp.]
MKITKIAVITVLTSLFLASCAKEDKPQDIPLGAYDNGVLILNQGNFQTPNSSVSYLSRDLTTFQNNIFQLVNPSEVLGDTGQDIGFYGDLAYIVMNVSNKIEVVNRYSMKHVTSIETGLSNPRYIAFFNGKGFVTNWGDTGSTSDDFVAVINLATNTVSSSISVVEGPERIVAENNSLYVAHKGGYGFGNSISVINPATNTVSKSIPVGDVPNTMAESNGVLYVLCEGIPSWPVTPAETGGKLVKINLATNTVSSTINFGATVHPQNLIIDSSILYYTEGSNIYATSLVATTLPNTPIFSTTAQGVYGVYSFEVENNKVYVGDALDYSANGKVYIYSLLGALEKEYTVGVSPAGFYFNL